MVQPFGGGVEFFISVQGCAPRSVRFGHGQNFLFQRIFKRRGEQFDFCAGDGLSGFHIRRPDQRRTPPDFGDGLPRRHGNGKEIPPVQSGNGLEPSGDETRPAVQHRPRAVFKRIGQVFHRGRYVAHVARSRHRAGRVETGVNGGRFVQIRRESGHGRFFILFQNRRRIRQVQFGTAVAGSEIKSRRLFDPVSPNVGQITRHGDGVGLPRLGGEKADVFGNGFAVVHGDGRGSLDKIGYVAQNGFVGQNDVDRRVEPAFRRVQPRLFGRKGTDVVPVVITLQSLCLKHGRRSALSRDAGVLRPQRTALFRFDPRFVHQFVGLIRPQIGDRRDQIFRLTVLFPFMAFVIGHFRLNFFAVHPEIHGRFHGFFPRARVERDAPLWTFWRDETHKARAVGIDLRPDGFQRKDLLFRHFFARQSLKFRLDRHAIGFGGTQPVLFIQNASQRRLVQPPPLAIQARLDFHGNVGARHIAQSGDGTAEFQHDLVRLTDVRPLRHHAAHGQRVGGGANARGNQHHSDEKRKFF